MTKPGGKVRRETKGRFVDFDATRRIETRLRRVTEWIEEKGEEMELLTTDSCLIDRSGF